MQKMKWSVIAFAVAAATSQMAVASQQSESNGFIEDSKLDLHSRVLYFNRDYRNGADNGKGKGYNEDLGLGMKLIYESGFTKGTVGFGVDAFAMQGIKLDSGEGRHGNNQFPTDGRSGKAQDNYSEAGAAIKARISSTELKYGNQFVDLPVFSMDDSRLLPESATGFLITSNEIAGLELHAGRFTALNSMDQTARDSANEGWLRSIDLAGGRYNFTDNLSAAYYYADAELGHSGLDRVDSKKHYVNLNYVHPIADNQSVTVDFNAYSTRYDEKGGDGISKNNARSLALAYNLGAHTFTVAKQCVEGNHDAGYDYGYDGGGSVYLANDIQVHGFHKKGEDSYQARYDLDMASYGVPGLSFMARYVRGTNIANIEGGVERNQGKNWERNLEAQYVVQSGPAKDLSLRLRHATYRANAAALSAAGAPASDIDEVRFIVEYPLSIL